MLMVTHMGLELLAFPIGPGRLWFVLEQDLQNFLQGKKHAVQEYTFSLGKTLKIIDLHCILVKVIEFGVELGHMIEIKNSGIQFTHSQAEMKN